MAISSLKNLSDIGEERDVGWYEQFDQKKKLTKLILALYFFVFCI